jgi:DNA-directed RNA polymerase subunit beta'
LDMSPRELEEIIYFASYVVIESGDTGLEKKQLLSERDVTVELKEEYGNRFKLRWGPKRSKAYWPT